MKRQRWASWEIKLIEDLYREGISEKEIARQLGRSLFSISKKIDQSGLRAYKEDRKRERQERVARKSQSDFHQKLTSRVDALIQSELSPLVDFASSSQEDSFDYRVLDREKGMTEREEVSFRRRKEMIVQMIIDFFQSRGQSVRRTSYSEKFMTFSQKSKKKPEPYYLLDGKYFLTEGQLLLRYNMIQEEMRKPLLYFPEIA